MPRYGMVININRCSGCYNCQLACKDEHCGHDYPGYSTAQPESGQFWMKVTEKERGKYPKVKISFTPLVCQHCKDATCVKSSSDGAVYRRADGIVIIDPVKAKGNKQIVSSCPYRVIYWNEEKSLPQKCTLCAHLLDEGWKVPRCVELCPTGALVFGDLDNPKSEAARLVASGATEILHPEYGLRENVSYMGIPKKFVAGTVAYEDTDQCASEATVTLTGKGIDKKSKTNDFGDFEFEGLPDNIECEVKVEAKGYKAKKMSTKTVTDIYLGVIKVAK